MASSNGYLRATAVFCFSILYPFTSLPRAHALDTFSVPSTLVAQPSVSMPPMMQSDSTMHRPPKLPSTLSSPSFPDQPPLQAPPELFIAAEQSHSGGQVKNRVFNYYFLFLALLTAVLAALLWWLHRQRRREREQTRLRGHSALARDIERWAMNRRDRLAHVEGLNEAGEAPPPYKAKNDAVITQDPVDGNTAPADSVTMPPRALSRDETEHSRLPDYFETIQSGDDLNPGLVRPTVQHAYSRADISAP